MPTGVFPFSNSKYRGCDKYMSIASDIETKLRIAFKPDFLSVVDESHLHAGHIGARPEGETHFRVEITSNLFKKRTRVDQQRMVYDVLRYELSGPVHALALSTRPP